MKLKRQLKFKWGKLRWPLLLIALIVVANVAYHQTPHARHHHALGTARIVHNPIGLQLTAPPPPQQSAVNNDNGEGNRPPAADGDDVNHHESDSASSEQSEVVGTPRVLPSADNVRLLEVSVEGGMSMRAEGPPDPQDAKLLFELAPALSHGGGTSDDAPMIELHPAERSAQRTRHMRRLANQAQPTDGDGKVVVTSTLRTIVKAVESSIERVERKYRFVLIVVAVRSRRHLDVYLAMQEWKRQCDTLETISTSAKDRGGVSVTTRPLIVCLMVFAFPSDYTKRSVLHYTSLFDDDDSVLTLRTDTTLSSGGISKLHELGFEQGVQHFSRLLGVKAEIDYVLLTALQFTPVPKSNTSLFMSDLVKQFESASDVVDVLARRVAGGATRRGPILGCTAVLDEVIAHRGPASDYNGNQVVIDHGVDFLFGNGGGGAVLNSMYAVRRHAGLSAHDERIRADAYTTTAHVEVVPSQSGVNASMLPHGVESVHSVSPHCVMMSERIYRSLLDYQRKHGGGIAANPQRTDGGLLQDDDAATAAQAPATTIHSMLEDFEDLVGTGNHRSSGASNRSNIAHYIRLDPEFEPFVMGRDTATTKAQLLDVAHLRIIRLDKLRSSVRFADVMSGSPRYKRLVSYFIRYLDESIRFFDTYAPESFFNIPKERLPILQRLSKRFRAVEAAHEENLRLIASSREDTVITSILYASRALDAITRWNQQDRAQRHSRFHNQNTLVPEESHFWNLCLLARKLMIPSLIGSMKVRLQQHEYLEGALLSPHVGSSVAPSPNNEAFGGGVAVAPSPYRISPIYQAYTAGVVLPVSTRLGGPYQALWEASLRKLLMHPSFHQRPRLQVVWYTHCCHCCGFSNELQSLVYPLQHYVNVHLTAGPECFCNNASRSLYDTLERLHSHPQNIKRYQTDDVVVYISHTNPTLFHLHRELNADAQHDYLVGRSMYEFSRINAEHIAIANRMADEIWVPAQFVYHSYLSSGAKKSKLVIVPEAIDTHTFNPDTAKKIQMPPKDLFHMCNRLVTAADVQKSYTFLSDFKWEPRKGWDVLFESYFRAFTKSDNVVLFVMTHIWFSGGPETYGWANNITWIMQDLEDFMRTKTTLYDNPTITRANLPSFCIISQSLAASEIAALYNSVDAFAYTTRGEGWGLPAMQAMSMGLPVMATNFGGVTEFMKPFNSFLVQVDGVVEIPFDSVYGWSFGTKWAEPSINEAVQLFRYLSKNKDHGRRVGKVARKYIVDHFSEEALGVILNGHLQRIREKVLARRLENEMRQQLSP
ncbi:mannosyltransferase, putative [Bodo saltans]|uniref:Mannosyltransferase, putative n=1 Tax=Bodo saltans TaxID=75058 RepID=A0A0S4JNQ5_BODSA|nr:mannosyltransferase, putative [Bodo saltans]|eukprot:CUG93173.1 mannosyltransferase, putative [Bodo saltans]